MTVLAAADSVPLPLSVSSPGFLEESPLSVFSSPAGSSASISTVSV